MSRKTMLMDKNKMQIISLMTSYRVHHERGSFKLLFRHSLWKDKNTFCDCSNYDVIMSFDKMASMDPSLFDIIENEDWIFSQGETDKAFIYKKEIRMKNDDKLIYESMNSSIILKIPNIMLTGNSVVSSTQIVTTESIIFLCNMFKLDYITMPITGTTHIMETELDEVNRVAEIVLILNELIVEESELSTKRNKWRKDEIMTYNTLEDLKSIFSDPTSPMSKIQYSSYSKSRHEVVAMELMRLLNINMDKTDMTARVKYNYMGIDSHLTPDMFFEDERTGKIHIIDVAVTRVSTSMISQRKEQKYALLSESLSLFLNKDVVSDSVVMSVTNAGDLYMPNFLRNSKEEMLSLQDDIMAVENIVKMRPKFLTAREEFEAGLEMETVTDKKRILAKFNTMFLKMFDLKNKKSVRMSTSFFSENTGPVEDVCTNNMDEFLNEIKDDVNKFTEDKLLSNLMADYNRERKKGTVPMAFRSMKRSYDLKTMKMKMIKESMVIRRNYENNPSNKIPKIFKFPLMPRRMGKNMYDRAMMDFGVLIDMKGDGTHIYRDYSTMDEFPMMVSREGIGINVEQDTTIMEKLMNMMRSESTMEFRKEMKAKFRMYNARMESMFRLRIFEMLWSLRNLAMNICYLEGRRFVNSSKETVAKIFEDEGYILVVRKGSRITQEGQINYKIVSETENDVDYIFHTTTESDEGDFKTDWLTTSMSDMRTMVCIFEKAISLASHYMDCYEESKKSKILDLDSFLKSDMVLLPLIHLMEMKRSTSTTSQYNRYIFNSMLGFASDKEKTMKDIMKDPIRSRFESFVRIKQMDWAIDLEMNSKMIWKKVISKSCSTSADYDELYSSSIYSNGTELEFSFVINDMYLGNLFQSDAGFSSHRSKSIMEKMMTEEKHYMDIRDPKTMNSDMTFEKAFSEKDEKHRFSKEFIMLMGKMVSKKLKKHPNYEEVMASKIIEPIKSAMMMTKSLYRTTMDNNTLEMSTAYENKLSFLTMDELVNEHGTSLTMAMVSKENIIEAIFSLFAKSQIGGPREILIQSYKLRIHVKMMEIIMEGLCSLHEKEMLTKGKEKEMKQSNTATLFKKTLIDRARKERKYSFTPTLVADASRWAPSFTMPMFAYFLNSLGLPEELTEHFNTILRAFSVKYMMMPKALSKKWKKKPTHEEEGNDIMEWTRRMADDNNYFLKIFAGMGQGMLHKFSSLIGVAKDDVMERMLSIKMVETNVQYTSSTMISSDDLLKQMLISGSNIETIFKWMEEVMIMYETTNQMSNIHTNWKKTSLSFVIDEFNSYFTRGKKATMAVIKDIFTMAEVVDLTSPDDAVKNILSNISRAFNNGMYEGTMDTAFMVMRNWLIDSYAYKEDTIKDLMSELDCSFEDLPADLGFLSTKHQYGQVVFGNQILMHEVGLSSMTKEFYKGTYSGMKETIEEITVDETLEVMSGKIKMVLPYRSDKRLKELINEYYMIKGIDFNSIMENMEKNCLMTQESAVNLIGHKSFTDSYFLGTKRNYAFNTSMQMNSLIRALQMTSDNIKCKPDIDHGEECSMSVLEFTRRMINRKIKSSFHLMDVYARMMSKVIDSEEIMKGAFENDSGRHLKRRLIRFRTKELVMNADSKEIKMHINNTDLNLSNRMIKVIEDICDMCMMSFERYMKDPLMEIKEKFNYTGWPIMSFLKVVECYMKLRMNFSSEMMTSFSDKGNATDNLVSLMCERKKAHVNLSVGKREDMYDLVKGMMTWVSIGKKINDFPINELKMNLPNEDTIKEILSTDSSLMKGVKLLNSHINKSAVISDHVFTSFKKIRRINSMMSAYCDMSGLFIMISNDMQKKIEFYLICNEKNPENLKSMWMLMQADMMSRNMSNYDKLFFNGHNMETEMSTWDIELDYFIKSKNFVDRWSMIMSMPIPDVTSSLPSSIEFKIMSDRYTMHLDSLDSLIEDESDFVIDFQNLIRNDMTVMDMQEFMLENKLYSEKEIVRREMAIAGRFGEYDDVLDEEISAFNMKMTRMEYDVMVSDWNEDKTINDFKSGLMEKDNSEEEMSDSENFEMLDFDGLEDLKGILDNAFEAEDHLEVEVSERKNMNGYICSCLMMNMFKEISIDHTRVEMMFNNIRTEGKEKNNKAWSILTTELKMIFDDTEDWMLRLMVSSIYHYLRQKIEVPRPSVISIITNYTRTPFPLIAPLNLDNYNF